MFKERVISGIIIAVAMLGLTWLGGIYLLAALLAVSIIGLFEFYRATGVLTEGRYINLNTGIAYGATVVYYICILLADSKFFMLIFITVVFLLVLLAAYVFTFPKLNVREVVFSFYGFFYVGVMLSFLYLTRSLDNGIFIVWLVYTSSWLCDVFAYFTGMLLGKHKLCPQLSPKKSVEGAVGGIVIPAIIAGVYGYLIRGYYAPGFPVVPAFALITAIGAAASQLGDLSASAIKRNHDIKDYGKLIPGHGGILDRFDSMIFTAPMICFVAIIVSMSQTG